MNTHTGVDFAVLERLYLYAGRVAKVSNPIELEEVISDNRGLLQKEYDVKLLLQTSKDDLSEAKLKVLADPAFLIFRKVADGKAGKPRRVFNQYEEIFDRITETKIEIEELETQFGLRPFVLTQHTRFDPFPERGVTYTKKIKGKRMIWREPPD